MLTISIFYIFDFSSASILIWRFSAQKTMHGGRDSSRPPSGRPPPKGCAFFSHICINPTHHLTQMPFAHADTPFLFLTMPLLISAATDSASFSLLKICSSERQVGLDPRSVVDRVERPPPAAAPAAAPGSCCRRPPERRTSARLRGRLRSPSCAACAAAAAWRPCRGSDAASASPSPRR